jgi:hypothetical protein
MRHGDPMRRPCLVAIGYAITWLFIPCATAHAFACISSNGPVPCPGPTWASHGATLQVGLGTSSFNQAALTAANDWNAVGAAFQYTVQFTAGPSTIPCNTCGPQNYNPVFFDDTVCGSGFGDIVAQANICWDQNNNMINGPVFVNSTKSWAVYDGPYTPPVNDLHRVLLHEFGHVLGLDHPDQLGQTVAAIMNTNESGTDTLQADDRAGIISLYPNSAPSGAVSGCRIAPSGASGAWMLVPPAVLLFLRKRRHWPERLLA